jgi:hypothetical protein
MRYLYVLFLKFQIGPLIPNLYLATGIKERAADYPGCYPRETKKAGDPTGGEGYLYPNIPLIRSFVNVLLYL